MGCTSVGKSETLLDMPADLCDICTEQALFSFAHKALHSAGRRTVKQSWDRTVAVAAIYYQGEAKER